MELALILAQAVMAFLSGNRDPTIVSPGDPSGIIALRQYEEADTAIPFPSGKSGRDFLFRTDDEWFVQTENGRFWPYMSVKRAKYGSDDASVFGFQTQSWWFVKTESTTYWPLPSLWDVVRLPNGTAAFRHADKNGIYVQIGETDHWPFLSAGEVSVFAGKIPFFAYSTQEGAFIREWGTVLWPFTALSWDPAVSRNGIAFGSFETGWWFINYGKKRFWPYSSPTYPITDENGNNAGFEMAKNGKVIVISPQTAASLDDENTSKSLTK